MQQWGGGWRVLLSPSQRMLRNRASGRGSGSCGPGRLRLRGGIWSRNTFSLEGSLGAAGRASGRNTSAPSPGTTHTQPACGIWGCLAFSEVREQSERANLVSPTSQMNSAKCLAEHEQSDLPPAILGKPKKQIKHKVMTFSLFTF